MNDRLILGLALGAVAGATLFWLYRRSAAPAPSQPATPPAPYTQSPPPGVSLADWQAAREQAMRAIAAGGGSNGFIN